MIIGITSRSQHPQGDKKAQEDFKKTSLRKSRKFYPPLSRKGSRPRVVRQQQFISGYISGAVCPAQDKGAAVIMPYANSYAMQIHLEEISRHVPEGRHAVVILDKAGWHTSKGLKIPSFIAAPLFS